MTYKTGDKIKIEQGAFIIDLTSAAGTRAGQYLTQAYNGVVVSTNCQLSNSNCTLLVKAGVGYLFVSPAEVSLTKPPEYFVCVLGVMVEVTKVQYEAVEEAENEGSGSYFTGTYNVEDWR